MTFGQRAALAGAGTALMWSLTGGCGIDLTEDVAGKPCKDGQCLPGYACVPETNICVSEDELSAGGAGGGQGARAGSGALSSTGSVGGRPTGGDGGRSAAGGGGSSGVGGTPPTGGTSGAGGASGAGGGGRPPVPDAGPDPDAATDAPPPSVPRPGHVACQNTQCDLSSDFCCVATFPGSDFSCSPTATGCQWSLGCDGDHDCPGTDVCCASQNAGDFFTRCRLACGFDEPHIECTAPQDCSGSQVCCGHIVYTGLFGLGEPRYDRIECQSTCTGTDDRIICNDNTDCTNGGVCNASGLYPGITICD